MAAEGCTQFRPISSNPQLCCVANNKNTNNIIVSITFFLILYIVFCVVQMFDFSTDDISHVAKAKMYNMTTRWQ